MAQFPPNEIMSLTAGAPRFDLAESVGPDLLLGELLDPAGAPELADLALGYGTAAGDRELRALVASMHGVGEEDVVITVGGMHALFLVAFTLCDAGDEAVIATPVFPPARNVLEAVRASVRTVPLDFDRAYRLDPSDLAPRLSAKTKLVSLASPQNPSGVAVPPGVIRDVLGLVEDICPQAYVLVDETYRDAVYGEDAPAPSALGAGERIISCASLSKCHGAPGLRLGWAITRDTRLRDQLLSAKFNTVVSCSRVDEALGARVLRDRESIVGRRRAKLAEGLADTARWAQRNAACVEWVRPDAGALCCVRLRQDAFDDAAVGRFYAQLEGAGARVASGAWFGEAPRVFRLGFGLLSPDEFRTGLSRLTAALEGALRDAA